MQSSQNAEVDKRYVAWLKENGATFNAIDWPAQTPKTGRGAIATKDVKPGDPFLTVPSKLIIDPPLCRKAPDIGPFLSSHRVFLESHELTIATYLCHERLKGKHSFWEPYIASLPKNSGSVYTWTKEELSEIQDEAIVNMVNHSGRRERASIYDGIVELLRKASSPFKLITNENTLTFDLFLWALDTVCCRSFGKRIRYVSLVPLADNLNHSNVQTKYDYDGKTFRLFPSGSNVIKAGSEAFNSYGRRSNTDLLLNYGFTLANNEWDEISLSFALPSEASDNERKRRLIPGSMVAQLKMYEECRNLMMFFRIVYATEAEIDQLYTSSNGSPSILDFQFLSLANEARALKHCRQELAAILNEYPTSIEHDEALLADETNPPTGRLLFAIRFRLGRKHVVKFHLDFVDALSAVIADLSKDARSGNLDSSLVEAEYNQIAAKLVLPKSSTENEEKSLSTMLYEMVLGPT